jgi:hypothetical protein
MDSGNNTYLGGDSSPLRKTFFNHVFSTTDEGKADIMNVLQYAFLGFLPLLLLTHTTQYLIPDVNTEKSSIEILVEIIGQIVLTFCGLIVIHRVVTYIPTYSEFKYDSLSLTSICLVSLLLMLSIRTKMGVKASILYDRAMEIWHGPSTSNPKKKGGNGGGSGGGSPGYVMQPAAMMGGGESIIPAMSSGSAAPAGGGDFEPRPFSGF